LTTSVYDMKKDKGHGYENSSYTDEYNALMEEKEEEKKGGKILYVKI